MDPMGYITGDFFRVHDFRCTRSEVGVQEEVPKLTTESLKAWSEDGGVSSSLGIPWFTVKENGKKPQHGHAVDGRNPAPVDMVNVPWFKGFYTSQLVQDYSINSTTKLSMLGIFCFKKSCHVPYSLPHTYAGLVFLGRFLGVQKNSPSQGVWKPGVWSINW